MDRRPNRHITQRGNNSWENVMSNLALENGLGETSTRPSSYTESTKASRDLLYISGRVNKLDSELLDEEVKNILQEPLYESFKHFDPRILNRKKCHVWSRNTEPDLQQGIQSG
ncbi:hypothetical protein AX774_g1482 [Zancudomyces culisetae]|uniref:Uncharacterized protein n=1 Tax=Zancudomyces culisetae TaxID=1213189 RepID=A0A1R1PVI9_ZANCU|nr:hypothetical protein AX774_g1482 [Zancudomyces culisetae]|eukprot:OMH84973.1 hypothetical protein AX774_g1482 [Zancudomyces culisetae]